MLKGAIDALTKIADEDYPAIIHIPHNFISMTNYREWREEEGQPRQWLFDLVMSFFSHSQGSGAMCTSLISGKTLESFGIRPDYSHYHFIVYLLTYWSPRDIVYRIMSTPRHPLRLFCIVADALDGVTTVGAVVDSAVKAQPGNKLLPVLGCIILYAGSQIFRHLDYLRRGVPSVSFLACVSSDVTRGALLGSLYWCFGHIFHRGRQRSRVLVILCLIESVVELLEDIYDFDAYERLHLPGLAVLQCLRKVFSLGPPPQQLKLDSCSNGCSKGTDGPIACTGVSGSRSTDTQ